MGKTDRLGVSAGETEEPTVMKTDDGQLRFHLTSASPLAIAWGEAALDPNDPNNPDNPNATDGSEGPETNTRVELKKISNRRVRKTSPALVEAGYTADAITQELKDSLAGFGYEDIEIYEMRVSVRQENSWERLTEENFQLDGVAVRVKCPKGSSTEGQDFAVAHMHSYDSDRLGVYMGSIETPTVTKTGDGEIEFTVTSASPLAIAWKTAANPEDPGTTNPDNPGTDNPDDPNGDGSGDGSNTGTNGGSSTSGTVQNSGSTGNAVTDAISSVMPKTGDPISFIPWIVLVVASIAVLIGVKKRGKSKKASKAKSKKRDIFRRRYPALLRHKQNRTYNQYVVIGR